MYDKTVTVFNKYTDKNDAETIAWFQGIPTWWKSAGQQSIQAVDSIVCQKESD